MKPSPDLKDADQQLEITDGEGVHMVLRLTQAPDADVTVTATLDKLHSSDTRLEGVTISPVRFTFRRSNWNKWKIILVSARPGAGERGIIHLEA